MGLDSLVLVGSSGRKISASAEMEERKAAFPPLGIVDVVKLQWESKGLAHELDLVDSGGKLSWDVLPDFSGVVVTNKRRKDASLASVISSDGSIRFVLENPWPKNKLFSPMDDYGFSYPTKENGKPGVVVWVWSPSIEGGVSAEHFYIIDVNVGEFLDHHPIK